MKKQITVVGAIIFDNHKVLCAQRSEKMSLPLMWEFPGGKIEQGESDIEAIKREIREEMKCDLEVGEKVTTTTYEYDFAIIQLTTYRCQLKSQLPTLTEHKAIQWLDKKDLKSLTWAPADIPAVEIIVSED
ncbi:(deoxy)nucleoside triphosphate pyrophosphohydrolase [Staphylococcus chromogenes]|uniref:8-oxo-dGTP diphosphatase n=1 Tax=Staphylococcus chromogenes TaxID=46126 RepID=A0ABD5AVN5_STACR|nr:(deoxy)nucleoside triphosphate pyrophosphohydrolase [Staphylococcus chromogenes]MDQ7175323.1 (deoxy)nucleoside triphosphate pyrophosphohydrolase [Staphylococcus chromogenes]MDU0451250.1 (deoxy)nucleoside triphosphate pyrophosphohydrolase [Staphylococcus chromogenes]PTF75563.1 (deoxy)nucleoside triphosphate pyrophosphohydrolase [Staphylococcus chromogenes]PTF80121.1 (deoxy)nucleoside triphosphate pyrophosphohydrolase [Staphylococcus chromogenes]PTG53218.1 (deoxy)nucleoside triphosphate pyrop